MRKVMYPNQEEWAAILQRPSQDNAFVVRTVTNILADVLENGDAALRHCSRHFDKVEIDDFLVSADEIRAAAATVPEELKAAIAVAKANIEKFHTVAESRVEKVETSKGVFCWKCELPIEKVGLYIPAGSAPLFSTVLMLAIPAKLAGCREIIITTPPRPDGTVDPVTLYTAGLCGVTRIYMVGGAQAIAALAYGTISIPKVHKIFGPGNQYVTEAKLQVIRSGVAIDMPAGPSEVAIFADASSEPAFVAADLLAQAEHGGDSQVMLFTDSETVAEAIESEVERQIQALPRRETAGAALGNSAVILVRTVDEAMDMLNEYAPEHLIIATTNPDALAEKVTNAGSVFLGHYSCESAGDYASGTNHTLPTGGAARGYSGVSVASFRKSITFQSLTAEGIRELGPAVEIMAAAEGLDAHKNAVSVRLDAVGRKDGI